MTQFFDRRIAFLCPTNQFLYQTPRVFAKLNGDGSLPTFGAFFKALGLKTYAFYDQKLRKAEENQKFIDSFDVPNETAYTGIELLVVAETPVDRQRQFLDALRNPGSKATSVFPPHVRTMKPSKATWRRRSRATRATGMPHA